MNVYGQCYPYKQPCPKGYWRADYDETGACVKKPVVCIDIFPPPPGCRVYNPASVNGTAGGNVTDSIGNATDTTPPDIPPVNLTQSDGGGAGGANETIIPEPPIECPEGEQPSANGLSCESITAEEPTPIECGEGEELIDGQCQAIPTEEPDEEPPEVQEDEGDTGGDAGGGDEEGGDEEGGN